MPVMERILNATARVRVGERPLEVDDCVLRNQGAAARSIESMPVVYARRPRPWHSLTTDVHAPTTDRERRELSICERL